MGKWYAVGITEVRLDDSAIVLALIITLGGSTLMDAFVGSTLTSGTAMERERERYYSEWYVLQQVEYYWLTVEYNATKKGFIYRSHFIHGLWINNFSQLYN